MNLPNALSLVRLVLVPVFLAVFLASSDNYIVAAMVYLVASATDVLDGIIARSTNQITQLGRILDPLADKLMSAAVLVCLWVRAILPWWVVAVYFLKEMVMGAGALVQFRIISDVPPSKILGKLATVLMFATCLFLMLINGIREYAVWMVGGVLVISAAAFFTYFIRFLQYAKKYRNED